MIPFLLKFLGVKIEAAQEVSSASLQLRHGDWLGWIVFIALLLGYFTWWVYRRVGAHRHLAAGRRHLLTALRMGVLLLLLFILLRPVVSFTIENRLRRTLIALVDKSSSMDIPDIRRDETDIKRAAIAMGKIDKLDQSLDPAIAAQVQQVSRADLMKAAFANSHLDLLGKLKKKYDIEYVNFNRAPIAANEEQAFRQAAPDDDARQSTAIGDAVRDVLNRKRGQPVVGILLVTDGANNSGSEPLEAATAAAQDKIPLYVYGVGITSPRDIIVDSVFTPDVAFIKDEVQVTVRVRAQGLKGQKAQLSLKMGDQEVASKELEFSDDGEQAVPLKFTPEKPGEFDLTASIPTREDETVKDHNTATQRLRVIDTKIKVLFVEDLPRWEFRFAQSVLARDRRLDSKFLLLQADPGLSSAADSPYIAKFPATKDELFKYDLIIIGDVDAKAFSQQQMDFLQEFVSKFGGAVVFLAGQQYNPATYAGTPFAKMLPVEVESSAIARDNDRPTTLALTSQGRNSPMLKFSPDEKENAEIWQNFPQIQWISRVSRAKPGAQVLLEDTDPSKMTRFGKMPAMAMQQYGVGQVLYLGTDNTWRWRQETGTAYHPLFWGQMVQRMALAHLLGGSKRTQLSVDKQRYNTSERVTVFARLYDQNFEPIKESSVNGFYTIGAAPGQPESPRQSVQLRALPDQPGMYRGDFAAASAGDCKFFVENDPQTVIEFVIGKSRFELGETAMNELLLKEMARVSGGVFFREEGLATLPQKIFQKEDQIAARGGLASLNGNAGKRPQNDEGVARVIDADLWSSPFYFLLICLLFVTEWILRKRYELK